MRRSSWRRLAGALPWLIACAALVAAGYVAARGPGRVRAAETSTGFLTLAESTTTPARAVKRPPPRVVHAAAARPGIEIEAVRGDCWVEARAGSVAGRQLFYGLLRHGRKLRLTRPAVWVRLGAGANVDVVVDGKRQQIPNGTIVRTFRAAT